ncbi:hypothetical protein [Aneurinibacillus tyrosinisolvens]|uniref:hypothetical protein n=1 Tax=Aneurinibacillus tyrosinisolvens TaxID=1443435 RepID=UPI00069B1B05|nr:hypothetical protein [Aneurinibacillus tyrosinisolvens]
MLMDVSESMKETDPDKHSVEAAKTLIQKMDAQKRAALLQTIASETGGSYYNVSNAQDLSPVFEKIYYEQQDRYLIGERAGSAKNSTYYAVLRVLLLAGIGALIGLSLGIVFDNRYLARSFSIGGVVAGLLAGGILEIGLGSPDIPGYPVRLLADVVLAAVLTLFTIIVPLRDTNTPHDQRRIYGKRSGSASAFGSGRSNSQGF